MGQPVSLLGGARAFARDYPRDQMPRGYLWDVADYVPLIIDAPLTGRGGWKWGSNAGADGDFESGIIAPFTTGEQALFQTTAGTVWQVDQTTYALTNRGTSVRSLQNPTQLRDTVIAPDINGAAPPTLWRASSLPSAYDATGRHARVATVFKSMLVTGNAPGEEWVIRFSVPGQDLTTAGSYDVNSFYLTTQTVTGLAALRAALLVFHPGSVERLRGSTPAHGVSEQGDMFIEPLFDRVGCRDARTIALWNDNCVFADEHGVHITDAAVIRNLVSQGGILYYWRNLWGLKATAAGCTFLDYYIITLRLTSGPPVTLICDLNKRQWYRFTNINALFYAASGGTSGMERVLAGIAGKARLARLGPCFFPAMDGNPVVDDDGTTVLPVFETPWYRLGPEGRKRIRFGYLSYDVRTGPVGRDGVPADWRAVDDDGAPPPAPAELVAKLAPILNVSYIRSPQQASYTSMGNLPDTTAYSRYKLPLGQHPFGVAFKVQQTASSTVTRIFDLAVEAGVEERSRQ